VVNGKKIDLKGSYAEIPLGDYLARLGKNTPNANLTELGQKYEVVLPDGTVWRCIVAGFSE
jgi:hypothetical protein